MGNEAVWEKVWKSASVLWVITSLINCPYIILQCLGLHLDRLPSSSTGPGPQPGCWQPWSSEMRWDLQVICVFTLQLKAPLQYFTPHRHTHTHRMTGERACGSQTHITHSVWALTFYLIGERKFFSLTISSVCSKRTIMWWLQHDKHFNWFSSLDSSPVVQPCYSFPPSPYLLFLSCLSFTHLPSLRNPPFFHSSLSLPSLCSLSLNRGIWRVLRAEV